MSSLHQRTLAALGLDADDATTPNERRLVQRIRRAAMDRQQLRIVGNGHAAMFGGVWSNGSGSTLNVRDYVDAPRDADVQHGDDGVARFTVSAGCTLGECRDFLRRFGLRLRGTPEAATITVGGACSMASHGGGAAWYCMAAYVDTLWFVDGLARVHKLKRGHALFADMLVSHGLCGVLLRVRLRVFPARRQLQSYTVLPSVPTDLGQRVRDGTEWPHLHSITFGPYTKRALVRQDEDTDAPLPSCWTDLPWRTFDTFTSNNAIVTAVDWLMTVPFPSLQRTASESAFGLPRRRVLDAYNYFVPLPSAPVIYDLAYAIRIDQLVPCYEAVQSVIDAYERAGVYIGYRFWCRVLRAHDHLPHSLAAVAAPDDEAVVVFDIVISRRPKRAWEFAQAVDAVFARFNARPHLGKTLVRAERALEAYDWTALRALRDRFDPHRVFAVPWFLN